MPGFSCGQTLVSFSGLCNGRRIEIWINETMTYTLGPMSELPNHDLSAVTTADQRIAAAVRALAAGRGVKNAELAPVIGTGRATVFAKVKGEVPWKANEIEAVADYFDVSVGELFDGLGLFRDTKKPHRMTGGASSAGAPSGTRTPDPLIKSQLL